MRLRKSIDRLYLDDEPIFDQQVHFIGSSKAQAIIFNVDRRIDDLPANLIYLQWLSPRLRVSA